MRNAPDITGRHELVCPGCGLYMLLPKSATHQDLVHLSGTDPEDGTGCPHCGTEMMVRWAKEAA